MEKLDKEVQHTTEPIVRIENSIEAPAEPDNTALTVIDIEAQAEIDTTKEGLEKEAGENTNEDIEVIAEMEIRRDTEVEVEMVTKVVTNIVHHIIATIVKDKGQDLFHPTGLRAGYQYVLVR